MLIFSPSELVESCLRKWWNDILGWCMVRCGYVVTTHFLMASRNNKFLAPIPLQWRLRSSNRYVVMIWQYPILVLSLSNPIHTTVLTGEGKVSGECLELFFTYKKRKKYLHNTFIELLYVDYHKSYYTTPSFIIQSHYYRQHTIASGNTSWLKLRRIQR